MFFFSVVGKLCVPAHLLCSYKNGKKKKKMNETRNCFIIEAKSSYFKLLSLGRPIYLAIVSKAHLSLWVNNGKCKAKDLP